MDGVGAISRTASGDVTPSQSLFAFAAYEVETSKVVSLAQWVVLPVRTFNWKELRCHHSITVLRESQLGLECGSWA